MEEGNNNWDILLNKYLRNEYTPEEWVEMERQMKFSPIKLRQFRERTVPEEFMNQLYQVYNIDSERSWNNLEAKLPLILQPKVIPIRRRPVFKWALGLAGTIVLGVGLWWLQILLSSSRLPIKSYPYVVLPDGTERNLDDASGVLYEGSDYKIVYTNAEIVIQSNEQFREEVEDKIAVVTSAMKNLSIRLSDASTIQLNDKSTIRVPVYFTGNSRTVELTGEGFFEVTTSPVSFIVSLQDKINVIAKGTSFNVCSYDDQEVVTTLLKGKVVMTRGRDSIWLKEGEQVETKNKTFRPAVRPDKEEVTAWRNNEFYFKDRDLKELMLEIGRWYGYEVVFTSQNFIKIQSSGKLNRNTKLDDIISALEAATKKQINIKKEGKKLIISSNK